MMDRVLFVTCHEATKLKNTEGMFGKSDPYCGTSFLCAACSSAVASLLFIGVTPHARSICYCATPVVAPIRPTRS